MKWISVEERLPEGDSGHALVAYDKSGEKRVYVSFWFRRGDDSLVWRYDDQVKCVTHWMPLPDPPEPATYEPVEYPSSQMEREIAKLLHIEYCEDLAEEGTPWEVIAEPEPSYFATLKEAIEFRESLPEDSSSPQATPPKYDPSWHGSQAHTFVTDKPVGSEVKPRTGESGIICRNCGIFPTHVTECSRYPGCIGAAIVGSKPRTGDKEGRK